MTSRKRAPGQDIKLINHDLWSFEGGAATQSKLLMGNLITDTANTVNPIHPRAVKLSKIAIHAACAVNDVAGDWTLRIRKNESGSDTATLVFPLSTTPSKTAAIPSTEAIFQAADTYHVLADGPQKTVVALRVILEWEPI
jgi:hypothetical protein